MSIETRRDGDRMKRILQALGCIVLIGGNFVTLSSPSNPVQAATKSPNPVQKKYVIEIGWDAPSPEFVRANIKIDGTASAAWHDDQPECR